MIPLHKLGQLSKIAPEFYGGEGRKRDNLLKIMRDAFRKPDFYACLGADSSASN